ncbi:MAG: ABC transporter permease [Actinobacteria bacterium]|nr:ABC transporter permease [Actinomycetota bacterium]
MEKNRHYSLNKKRINLLESVFKIFQKGGVYISLATLLLIAGILSPRLLEPSHLLFILRIASILGIISIGQGLLIISRGIDLSVGASATLVVVLICAISMGDARYTGRVIFIALAVGMLISIINGLLVVKFKISPLVGSLGVASLVTGITYLFTKGFARGSVPEFISFIGHGRVFGIIPVSVIIWAVISAIIIYVLRKTSFGRYIFVCGANPRAAYMAGINPNKILFFVYIINGLLTGIAGIIWAGYLRSQPTLVGGDYYPLDSLTAVIIGGTTFAGGKGTILGTIVGVIIISLLSSLLNMIGLVHGVKLLLQGLIIMLMVFIYTGRKRIN